MLSGRVVEQMTHVTLAIWRRLLCFGWCDVKHAYISGLTGGLEQHSKLRRGKGETIPTGECLIKVREDAIKR
jgi:hypothetical protein